MKRSIAAILCAVLSCSATAFQPRTGHWWNPSESGRGFNIDIQNGVMVMTMYSYDSAGDAQWYIASGPMTGQQHAFSATLDKFAGGQCVSCAYRAPVQNGDDGIVVANFTSEVSATITLPGGHVSQIRPFNFGYGEVPDGMLGEWVFVEDIGSITFADRFRFTQTFTASDGTVLAIDTTKLAGCGVGGTPTEVVCADVNASGAIENGYVFDYGLDETFQGSWISPATGNVYPMKGMRTASAQGLPKSATRNDAFAPAKGAYARGGPKASPDRLSALVALAAHIREAMRP